MVVLPHQLEVISGDRGERVANVVAGLYSWLGGPPRHCKRAELVLTMPRHAERARLPPLCSYGYAPPLSLVRLLTIHAIVTTADSTR